MATVVEWGPAWIIKGCARCNRAIKRPKSQSGRRVYCTEACFRAFMRDEQRARRWREKRSEVRYGVPVHVVWPGMIEIADRVQKLRPSYWRTA